MSSTQRRIRSKQPRELRKAYRPLLIEPLEGRLLLTGITVNTASDLADHSGMSLRDAITEANGDAANGVSDTIGFASDMTITLAQGQLELGASGPGSGTITIQGGGQIAISGNNASGVFKVDFGISAVLEGLTVEDGSASDGAGINNAGTLTVTTAVLLNNTAQDTGGGIYTSGTLIVSGSTFVNNTAEAALSANPSGDGIYCSASGTLTISSSNLVNNYQVEGTVCNYGTSTVSDSTLGFILNYGQMTLTGVTIVPTPAAVIAHEEAVTGRSGFVAGAIYNGEGGTMTVTDCDLSDFDYAGSTEGGAIYNLGTMTLSNSTLSGDSASNSGGAIYNDGTLTVSESTISGNSAPDGGGIYNAGVLKLLSTIVAGNTASYGPDIDGSVSAGSDDFIGNSSGASGLTNGLNNNQVGNSGNPLNPLLGLLENNGGNSQTMAPLQGSPAIAGGGPLTALTGSVLAANTTINVGLASAIAVTPGNYVIQIDGEQMLVTSVNLSSNTLTVQRGYDGTTVVDHAITASVYLATDQVGQSRGATPDIGAFEVDPNAPSVINTTTNANTQSTSGLVIAPSTLGGGSVVSFQITSISGGELYQNDGSDLLQVGSSISVAQAASGLKFTPTSNSLTAGSFTVQESTDSGPTGSIATATIGINLPQASITSATTFENEQNTTGLVITPDFPLVSYIQITNISGGTLYENDGTTPIHNGDFISVAQLGPGQGLKFTPTSNSVVAGIFTIQESTAADCRGLIGLESVAEVTVNLPGEVTAVWNGTGNGTSWSDPLNWVGGVVPAARDNAVIDVSGDATIVYDTSAGSTTIQNLTLGAGVTLSVTGGSLSVDGSVSVNGAQPISGPFTLAGGTISEVGGLATFSNLTVDVAQGNNAVDTNGTFVGVTTLNVAQNATFTFEATNREDTFSGTLTGSGAGTVLLSLDRLYIGIGGLTLNFSGGILQWTGGAFDAGNGNLTNLGTLNLVGSEPKDYYNDGTLDNFGTIVQTGSGYLHLGTDGVYPSTFKNEAGASYLLEGDSGLDEGSDSGSAPDQTSIINAGTIRKTAGTGVSLLAPLGSINNTGIIEADSGEIDVDPVLGVAQVEGSSLVGGTWDASNGASIGFAGGTRITTNAANLALAGAGSMIAGLTGLNSNTGQFSLTGGAMFTTAGNFANTGTLTVGAGSVLTVTGNFTQSSPGVLDDQIGGAPGSGLLGKIAVSGSATLGGRFNLSLLNGFIPTAGQSFPVLSFASEGGNFASLNGLQSLLSETLASSSLSLLAGNPADLMVSSATAPATALAGQSITVNWQVTDAGSQAASGSWQDSVYLSNTPTITASSILLGTSQYTLGLGAGSSYNGRLTAALPAVAPGNYYVLVQADSLNQSPDSNRANNTLAAAGQIAISLPSLTLGTPLAGAFTAADQGLYYQVSVPLGGSLVVTLASAAGAGSTALYVSQGTLPTPYSYQYAASVANQPNQTLIVPQTLAATVYYILAESVSGAAAAAGFTLTAAQTNALGISAISATTGGNTGNITLEIDGTNFTSSATASLKLGLTTLNATAIDFVSSSQLFATFNLAGAAVGSYALSVQQSGQTATAASAFNVVAAPAAALTISLSVPQAVRPGHAGTIVINYTNSSDNDIVAPLLEITSTNTEVTFSTPDDPNDFVSSAQLLAVAPSGPAGIVRPGQSGQLSLTILSNDTIDNDQIPIQVSQLTAGQTINWAAQQASLQPGNIPTAAWNVIFGNLLTMIGSSTDSFDAALAGSATYLSGIGETTAQTSDVGRLWSFMLAQAGAALPGSTLDSDVDASLAAPGGVSLSVDRTFASTIASRYTPGMFGVGWATSWQTSLSVDSSGNVTINSDGGLSSSFFVKEANGDYLDTDGEAGTLTFSAGVYTFTDTGQDQSVFLANGLLSYVQDTNGNRITLGYNGQNQITSLTYSNASDPAEPTEQLTLSYNAAGFVSQVADGTGNTWTYAYDAAGHLLSVTAPGDLTTLYTYQTGGNPETTNALLSLTAPDGSQENFSYDAQGRLAGISANNDSDPVTFAYSGGEITVTDALNHSTSEYLNDAGQAVKTIDPLGNVSYATVDNNGNVVSAQGPDGQAGAISYNSVGDPVSATDPLGHSTTATYSSTFDELTSLADPLGNTQNYAYNPQDGNLQTITYADGSQQQYAYDALGDVTEFVNQLGQAIGYSYNSQGLLAGETFSDGTQATFSYDAHQDLVSMTDTTGTTTFSYNAAGQLTNVAYPGGAFLTYTYNAAGQRTQMIDQTGFAVDYLYDTLGRLSALTDASHNLVVQYTYDAAGDLASELFGNGTETDYTYDADGRVTDIVNLAPGGSVQSSYAYTYNLDSLPIQMTTQAGTFTYGYDADGQLTSVVTPAGDTITYQYDANGNRVAVVDGGTTTTYTTNNLNQYTQVGGTTYQYNAAGQLISSTDSTGTTTYTYNAFGQVTSVVSPSGTSTYQYDALGFLISETVNGQVTNNLIDPTGLGNVVAQTDGSGNILAQYTYGLGLVSQVSALGASAYYSFDLTGNTTQLTGAGGAVLNTYSYLPFGQILSSTGTTANPFTYVGQYGVMDAGNGLYFMRNRFYDASTGRFVSPDPLGVLGSGTNLYAYTGESPIAKRDPMGLDSNFDEDDALFAQYNYAINVVDGTVDPAAVDYNDQDQNRVAGEWLADRIGDSAKQVGIMTLETAAAVGVNVALTPPVAAAIGDELLASLLVGGITDKVFPDALPALSSPEEIAPVVVLQSIKLAEHANEATARRQVDNSVDSQQHEDLDREDAAVGAPNDPNALIGPAGAGSQNFIQPTTSNLPYTVEFENDGSAPAQDVTVTEQLAANLDWTTFQLGSFGFGPINVTIPAGLTQYQTTVSYENQDGSALNVVVALDFNVGTGLLTATFTSLDPLTGQAPAGVFDGFLPTDDSSHVGEGYVQYTVQPTAGLTTGATIGQQAAVVFDTNTPVPTNTFTNTIDSGAPTSSVAMLADKSLNAFTVNWSGTDDAGGSGVASYDVYVSDDGGPYTLWQDQTTQTSAAYTGTVGDTYSFYSVATDNVGNVEPTPTVAEATTTIASGVIQNGKTLTVTGTTGADVLMIEFDRTFSVVGVEVNGVLQDYSTSDINNIVVNGVSGNDTLTVYSPPTEDATVALSSGTISFAVKDFNITSSNIPNIFYYAKVTDTAKLTDPAGANTLTVTPGYEWMAGTNFNLVVIGGNRVAAYSNGSGLDTADVQAATSAQYTAYVGSSFDFGYYPNGTYHHYEYGFATVDAIDTSGLVIADFYGNGSAAFQASVTGGSMSSQGFVTEASGFGRLNNYAGGAGDTIQLTTVGNSGYMQEFVAGEYAAYVDNVGVANGMASWAFGFQTVAGIGAGANTEVVFLPNVGNSNLVASGNSATMSTASETNVATGFATATAYASSGSNTDHVAVIDFALGLLGNWTLAGGVYHGSAD